MVRIWFNHWFSTAYNFIQDIRALDEQKQFYFIGTNQRDLCVYKLVCDEFYIEPELYGSEYVDWCVNFCKQHNINVFFARKNIVDISAHYHRFNEIGVKVITDTNADLIATLNDKVKTAELFRKHNLCRVPEIMVVNTVNEFQSAYKLLCERYPNDRICFKYAVDEGATSFRVVDNTIDGIAALRRGTGAKITYADTIRMLSEVERFDDLILMPYLKGPEISVDSIMTSKGFVGCTRVKTGTRCEIVDSSSEIIEISKRMAEITGIRYPYNLQLRWHDGELYLLEVNTRLAGGSFKSNMAGICFPYLALCDALGMDFELPKPCAPVTVSKIETSLEIE